MNHVLKIIFFLFFLVVTSKVFSNDTAQITQLLKRIEFLQVKHNGVFPKGLFPTYRMYALNKNRQIADPNVSFNAYITYFLVNSMTDFNSYQKNIAAQIIESSLAVLNKFKNKKGRLSYNFWPTDTVTFFPNSGLLSLFTKKLSLADDLDDTSLILMAQLTDSSTAQQIHLIMQDFGKNNKTQINNFFTKYNDINPYSTWFGKKMPVEIDVSVLCNILLFVQSYNLPWTKTDSSSLRLIVNILKDKKHLTEPEYMSHYYETPALILYHVSRLMKKKAIPELNELKLQMISDTKELFVNSKSFMEKVILSSTLLRLGVEPPETNILLMNSFQDLIEEDIYFKYFVANLSYLIEGAPTFVKKLAGKSGIGKFNFYCPAFNNLLLLENLVLLNRNSNK